jgi:hypothetical protein
MDAWQKQTDDRIKKLEDDMAQVKKAFPGSDFDGHCRYHEALIEDFAVRKRLVQTLKEKTIVALVWSGCGWIMLACWNEFKRRIFP